MCCQNPNIHNIVVKMCDGCVDNNTFLDCMRPSWSGHGDGLDTPYDETQPASQDRHSTGTPKGSADEAVQLRLGEEA